jgi:hypothetical protein
MMYDLIQQELLQLLPARRKRSNDWISFNAVCCPHNGESADTRRRGGVRPNADGSVSYHCFNCGFKTGFYPGRPIGFKFRKLLKWLGADDNTVQRLVMEALRIKELVPVAERVPVPEVEITFKPRPLPEDSASFSEWATMLRLTNDDYAVPEQLVNAVEYVYSRRIDRDKYDFYITDESSYNLDRRVIIPFTWKNQIIGYTARALADGIKPKYHNSHEPSFVFNVDKQLPTSQFVIVVEGPFDAMSVDGVAILSNEINDTQADIIESLGREVIVVPDFDVHVNERTGKKAWPGRSLIDAAIGYGWTVSFPVWNEKYKDTASAVEHLGPLFVIKSILDARETSALKIELKSKTLYNKL